MLLIIYVALAIIVLLFGLVVFAAFDVTIYLKAEGGRVDQYITIKWMGLSHKFKVGSGKAAKKEKKEEKPKKDKTKKKTSSIGISVWLRVLKTVKRPIIRFIEDVFGAVKFRKISCNLKYGFPDPADTGMLSGFLYALKGLFIKRCSVFNFSIYPQFQDEVFDLHVVTNWKVLGAAWFIFKESRKAKPNTN
jgi:hypothetical protein